MNDDDVVERGIQRRCCCTTATVSERLSSPPPGVWTCKGTGAVSNKWAFAAGKRRRDRARVPRLRTRRATPNQRADWDTRDPRPAPTRLPQHPLQRRRPPPPDAAADRSEILLGCLERLGDVLEPTGVVLGAGTTGVRDLRRDVSRLLRDARRDLVKMRRAVQRDLDRLQKDMSAAAKARPSRARRAATTPSRTAQRRTAASSH
jgi:hypothetical protein